jgi:hypothetical protein
MDVVELVLLHTFQDKKKREEYKARGITHVFHHVALVPSEKEQQNQPEHTHTHRSYTYALDGITQPSNSR